MDTELESHYTVDSEYWEKVFRSAASRKGVRQGFGIVGPRDMICREQLRTKALREFDPGSSVPSDAFIFALGEPKRRDVTKVGGAPYRAAGKDWPVDDAGKPLTFLAQFRFCESSDIAGSLPGDLLLIFVSGSTFPFRPPRDFLRFEWVSLGEKKLIARQAIPPPEWTFVTAYGLRYRTLDYVSDFPPDLVKRLVPSLSPNKGALALRAKELSRVLGMKIGGLPVYEMTDDFGVDSRSASRCKSSRLLCSFTSVGPEFNVPYPWANRADPLPISRALTPKHTLDFRSIVNIWIEADSELYWTVQYPED